LPTHRAGRKDNLREVSAAYGTVTAVTAPIDESRRPGRNSGRTYPSGTAASSKAAQRGDVLLPTRRAGAVHRHNTDWLMRPALGGREGAHCAAVTPMRDDDYPDTKLGATGAL